MMPELAGWANFYVIVGTAAGALIGLQFVVLSLFAQRQRRPEADAGDAFSTPTVLHFCAVFLLAAVVEVPWATMTLFAICTGTIALVGCLYTLVITKRMKSQTTYKPEFVDWMTYVIVPLAAFGLLLAAAGLSISFPKTALLGVGAAALMLLFIGIYNAWDTVTYHVFDHSKD
jgi:uncharacterized protein involved in cysteine biosynthesis